MDGIWVCNLWPSLSSLSGLICRSHTLLSWSDFYISHRSSGHGHKRTNTCASLWENTNAGCNGGDLCHELLFMENELTKKPIIFFKNTNHLAGLRITFKFKTLTWYTGFFFIFFPSRKNMRLDKKRIWSASFGINFHISSSLGLSLLPCLCDVFKGEVDRQ